MGRGSMFRPIIFRTDEVCQLILRSQLTYNRHIRFRQKSNRAQTPGALAMEMCQDRGSHFGPNVVLTSYWASCLIRQATK